MTEEPDEPGGEPQPSDEEPESQGDGANTAEDDSPNVDGEEIPEEERVPLSGLRDRVDAGRDGDDESPELEGEAPLSELAEDTESSTAAERSELFEEVDVGDVDAEEVWDAVVEEDAAPEELLDEGEAAQLGAVQTGAPDEHVINKRQYCQSCEYFDEPPDVGCTHEGTRILEMPENDCFRVRDCPKVGESTGELSSVIEE
jgi:hypothetical protein